MFFLIFCLLPGLAAAEGEGDPLTLDAALSAAFERHPQLAKVRAGMQLRRAFESAAGFYPFNPELTLEAAARIGDETAADFEVGLEQEFEIAGQRGRRKAVAAAESDAFTTHVERLKREISAQVRVAFVDAAVHKQLLEIARAELEISKQLVHLADRRLAAGAGTRLEIAVAGAELSKSEEQVNSAAGEYAIARAELAYVIGLGVSAQPEPVGGFGEDEPELQMTMAALMDAARENRQDLVALRKGELASKKRVELARAEAWPNLTLGVFGGQEAGQEWLAGGGITIPLPLFQRNQGEIAIAEAEVVDAEAETALAEQNVLRDVATAYQQYVAARQSLVSLQTNVVSTEEALQLLRRAFETGKSNWVEILVMRRTLFDAQRSLAKITANTHRARIKLDVATGNTPVPSGLTFEAENQ